MASNAGFRKEPTKGLNGAGADVGPVDKEFSPINAEPASINNGGNA
jgi:hypothetical protein